MLNASPDYDHAKAIADTPMAFATRLLHLIAPHAARALALAGRAGPRGAEACASASVQAIQAAVALQLEAARCAAYAAADGAPETEMAAAALTNVTLVAAQLMGGLVKAQLARLLLYTASNRQLRSAPGGTVIDRRNNGEAYSHVPADSFIRQVCMRRYRSSRYPAWPDVIHRYPPLSRDTTGLTSPSGSSGNVRHQR